jgi:hypothetical protein
MHEFIQSTRWTILSGPQMVDKPHLPIDFIQSMPDNARQDKKSLCLSAGAATGWAHWIKNAGRARCRGGTA